MDGAMLSISSKTKRRKPVKNEFILFSYEKVYKMIAFFSSIAEAVRKVYVLKESIEPKKEIQLKKSKVLPAELNERIKDSHKEVWNL